MASEVGVLDIPPERVLLKERLHPGRIFLVDTAEGRIVEDAELKNRSATQQPYGGGLKARGAGAQGCTYLTLSDRGVDPHHAPIPALLAVSGVHHRLIREGSRVK